MSYMEALMAILGGAISRSLREESLEALAYRDPLTGLLNRRALDERAAQAFDVAPGVRRTVTVVSLDINRLKQVNDTLGHLAGDQLIQSVARAMNTEFGRLSGTLVARVGGDEFTVLANGHDPVAVVEIADRLCQRTWRFGSGAGVSAGAATVTVTHGTTLTPHRVFAAADRAQYVAKHGRLSSTVVADDGWRPEGRVSRRRSHRPRALASLSPWSTYDGRGRGSRPRLPASRRGTRSRSGSTTTRPTWGTRCSSRTTTTGSRRAAATTCTRTPTSRS